MSHSDESKSEREDVVLIMLLERIAAYERERERERERQMDGAYCLALWILWNT